MKSKTETAALRLGKYEVTQGEYLAVMGNHPSYFNGGDYSADLNRPVEQVCWFRCRGL